MEEKKLTKEKLIKAISVTGMSVAIVGVGGFAALSTAYAQTAEDISRTGYPTIITNIAERFNLDPAEVEAEFRETKEERLAERLTELVSESVITEDQKNLIIEKQAEISAEIEAIKDSDLTPTEKRSELRGLRDEMREWMIANEIPEDILIELKEGNRGGLINERNGPNEDRSRR